MLCFRTEKAILGVMPNIAFCYLNYIEKIELIYSSYLS